MLDRKAARARLERWGGDLTEVRKALIADGYPNAADLLGDLPAALDLLDQWEPMMEALTRQSIEDRAALKHWMTACQQVSDALDIGVVDLSVRQDLRNLLERATGSSS